MHHFYKSFLGSPPCIPYIVPSSMNQVASTVIYPVLVNCPSVARFGVLLYVIKLLKSHDFAND